MDDPVGTSREIMRKNLHEAILSCIYLTNTNLIHFYNRLESKAKRRDYRIVYQSEALSIFKGNFVRLVKQLFGSCDVNRIKSVVQFDIRLDSVQPVVADVRIFQKEKAYLPARSAELLMMLKEAFANLTESDVTAEAYDAMKDVEKEQKKEKLAIQLSQVSEPAIKTLQEINFDSISNIKFK